MQWENLTSPDFARAVRETDVCILALGVLERHSDHLPLGTDFLDAHKIACLAAEKEPAVVFPPFYFGQIYEARCFPGAMTAPPRLLLEILQNVLDEVGRNGFGKIILFNGHGGNTHLVSFLAQCALWDEKPYALYLPTQRVSPERQAEWDAVRETRKGGHACEVETSITMANYPELVKMDAVPDEPGEALGRLVHLPPTYTGAPPLGRRARSLCGCRSRRWQSTLRPSSRIPWSPRFKTSSSDGVMISWAATRGKYSAQVGLGERGGA